MAHDADGFRHKTGNPNAAEVHDAQDAGDTPRDVGVTTRDASGRDGGVPRESDRRATFPIGSERSDDGAPTAVEDFEPREATPPTVSPEVGAP